MNKMNNSPKEKKHTNQSVDSKILRTDPPCAEGYVQDCSSGVCKCVKDESVDPPVTITHFSSKKIRDNK